MIDYKIIFTGSTDSGKSVAISSISDVLPTNKKNSVETPMDYGVMKINDKESIYLYGTPEQDKFDFMWDVLTTGGIGLVILINNSAEDPFTELKFLLESFSDFIDETKVVVGITNMQRQATPSIMDYHKELGQLVKGIPIFEVDVKSQSDIRLLIEALLFSIEPGILTDSAQLVETN